MSDHDGVERVITMAWRTHLIGFTQPVWAKHRIHATARSAGSVNAAASTIRFSQPSLPPFAAQPQQPIDARRPTGRHIRRKQCNQRERGCNVLERRRIERREAEQQALEVASPGGRMTRVGID